MTESSSKKATVVRPKGTPKDVLDRLEAAEAALARLSDMGLEDRLSKLEKRLGAFEVASPPEFRKLTPTAVADILKLDTAAEFEVLAHYKCGSVSIRKGSIIRSQTYPRFMDHVRNGLLVGVPGNQQEVLDKYREQREEREKAAAEARKELQARAALKALDPDNG